MHSIDRSRVGDAQIGQNSASANIRQRLQRPTPSMAFLSASEIAAAALRSFSSKWNAMRCADFGPTPGKARSASMRRSRDGGYNCIEVDQNGSFGPGGRFIPPIRLDIFSCEVRSTFWTASL